MTTAASTAAAAERLQRDYQTEVDRIGRALTAAPAAARDLATRMAAQAADDARRASSGVTINSTAVAERRAQLNAEAAINATKHLEVALNGVTTLTGVAARALAALREAGDALAEAERANVKEAARIKAESARLTELNASAGAQLAALRKVGISI